MPGKRGTLVERFWAKVEVRGEHDCWEWTAEVGKLGYGRITISASEGKVYAHRISWELHNGPIADRMQIDHLCHNRACVNPKHLRMVTQQQNLENRGVLQSNNTSGYRGVIFNKQRGRWMGSVKHKGQVYYCGLFDTPQEASLATKAKRAELFSVPGID